MRNAQIPPHSGQDAPLASPPMPDHQASARPLPGDRSEPNLSLTPSRTGPRLRLTESPPARGQVGAPIELRAGERLVVESVAEDERQGGGGTVKKVMLAIVIVLAVIGAASLVHYFAGL